MPSHIHIADVIRLLKRRRVPDGPQYGDHLTSYMQGWNDAIDSAIVALERKQLKEGGEADE